MNPNPLLALNHFTVPCSLTDVLTLFLSYLCFSTASSRNAKEAASWNLQPLQSNLKVLQEQQTQPKDNMLSGQGPVEFVWTVCLMIKHILIAVTTALLVLPNLSSTILADPPKVPDDVGTH